MIKTFENRQKLIDKYKDTIAFVGEHNGNVDEFVAYEMIVANVFRGGQYKLPENFDAAAFKADYEAFFA